MGSPQLTELLNQGGGQGLEDQWTVSCDEGGHVTDTHSGTLTVTSASPGAGTADLPTGGSVANSCAVTSTVRIILGVPVGLLSLPALGVRQAVTASVAAPGALWTRTASGGAVCADDTGNLSQNANPVQAYTCLGDLAQFWAQDKFGEFVHDGLCMTENLSAAVVLGQCFQSHEQEWTRLASGEVTLTSTPGECLTAPSSKPSTSPPAAPRLRVSECAGAAGQRWTVPGLSS